jgi:hypothetical protein
LAKQLYEAVRAQDYGRKGTQALMLALETLNNITRLIARRAGGVSPLILVGAPLESGG